jgi:hypothetical protein
LPPFRPRATAAGFFFVKATFISYVRCEESEIVSRIDRNARARRRMMSSEQNMLNKDLLRALSEEEQPTDGMMDLLQRIQDLLGTDLPFTVCKELLRLCRSDVG